MDQSSIELSAMEMAVKTLSTACGSVPSFFLSPGKGFVQFSASMDGNVAVFRVPGTIAGLDGLVEIPKDLFAQALKGRDAGALSLKNSVLKVKAGTYTSETNVSASESTAPDVVAPDDATVTCSFTMTPGLAAALATMLPAVRIERAFSSAPDIMVVLKSAAGKVLCAAYDGSQLCFVTGRTEEENTPEFMVSLPYTRLTQMVSGLPLSGCKISVTVDALFIMNKVFRICLPLPAVDQSDQAIDPASVVDRVKSVRKASGDVLSVSRADLQNLLDNAKALVAVGSDVRFTPSSKGATVSVSSPRGKVKQVIQSTGLVKEFGLGFAFMQTLIGKQPKKAKGDESPTADISFDVVDDTFVVCRGSATYLALLSADQAKED